MQAHLSSRSGANESYSSVTLTPGRLWRFLWWKSASHSWSHLHINFHLNHKPKPLGQAVCFRQQDRYSWDRRCSACGHSPSHCRLQGAAGRWRCSPHCPYEEYLIGHWKKNKVTRCNICFETCCFEQSWRPGFMVLNLYTMKNTNSD